jgi:hypothetical protein
MVEEMKAPVLAAAGAGLPWVEGVVARYVLFPLACRRLSRPNAIEILERLGRKMLQEAQALPAEHLTQQRLIKRFPGIEDSSRNWSVLMTVHHLLITGEAMAGMTERLAAGQSVTEAVRIEDVKPNSAETAQAVFSGYEKFLDGYRHRMEALKDLDWQTHRHPHPWFGPINAHQWLCLNALHHRIHTTQIQRILVSCK